MYFNDSKFEWIISFDPMPKSSGESTSSMLGSSPTERLYSFMLSLILAAHRQGYRVVPNHFPYEGLKPYLCAAEFVTVHQKSNETLPTDPYVRY